MDESRKQLCSATKDFTKGVTNIAGNIASNQKTCLGHNVSFSRSGEKDLEEKLDGLVSVPQEWHKKKVRFIRTK